LRVPVLIVLAIGSLFITRNSFGDSKSVDAKAHFQSATSHFAVGEFAEAADEYQKAYKLKPDPALLYNAAQSYRLANNLEKAQILYRNFLQLYPNEGNAEEVKAQITKLREAIVAADKAKNAPPTEAKPMTPSPERVELVEPTAPHTVTAEAPAKAERTPVYKKWWLWTIVGVVVVGAVVGGVVATQVSSGSWSNGPTVGPGTMALSVGF